MKKLKINTTSLITLAVGLLLGWLIFGGNQSNDQGENHNHSLDAETGTWTCSMHPQVQNEGPGKCPFCGMDLIPVATSDSDDPTVLQMSENAVKLANIQTIKIESSEAESLVKVSGRIETNETLIKSQVLHIPGRIERLFVDFTGQNVHRGQKIASIYSPELVTAQRELKEAIKLADKYPNLADAARMKFENWKLSPEQVKAIENSPEIKTTFDVTADVSGVVTIKKVQVGDHLKQGDELFEVSDLRRIWAIFNVYEQDLNKIKIGNELAFSVKAYPGEKFTGKIEFIDPVIDPATRTASVRVTVKNQDKKLKPEMLAEGNISSDTGGSKEIMVPKSAVLWTGERSIVYVQLKPYEPKFRLREVVLGSAVNDHYLIKEGLKEGDLVVVNGAFSVDAAAQLQGKKSMMGEGSPVTLAHNHEGHKVTSGESGQSKEKIKVNLFLEEKPISGDVPTKFKNHLGLLIESYLQLKDLLVKGQNHEAVAVAKEFEARLSGVDVKGLKKNALEIWNSSSVQIQEQVNIINSNHELAPQRTAFVTLSEYMIRLVRAFKPTGETLYLQHCPMANNDNGANWLSTEEKIVNPYFGDAMLNCGWVEQELK